MVCFGINERVTSPLSILKIIFILMLAYVLSLPIRVEAFISTGSIVVWNTFTVAYYQVAAISTVCH